MRDNREWLHAKRGMGVREMIGTREVCPPVARAARGGGLGAEPPILGGSGGDHEMSQRS